MFKAGDVVMVTAALYNAFDHRTPTGVAIGWVGEVIDACVDIRHNCCVLHITPRSHVKFSGTSRHCLPNVALKKLGGDPDAVDTPSEEEVSA